MTLSIDALSKCILDILDDMKAENILTLDVRGLTSICDEMVIATGRSSRQVRAIAEKLEEKIKHTHQLLPVSTTGFESGEWALIDYGDIIVHVMQPDARAFYNLEALWSKS
jgi:ribosome-associated protein